MMNDQMPDFEPDSDLSTPPAPKKPRRKPQKRTKREKRMTVTVPAPKRRKAVKKRRGRPLGALNKPKAVQPAETTSAAVYDVLATLIKMPKEERAQVALHMKGLFR
jgi:hypothetical protein